jgi:hypothetical protein
MDAVQPSGEVIPIFMFVSDMIQQEQTNRRFAQMDTTNRGSKGHDNSKTPWQYSQAHRKDRESTELAAAAGDTKLINGEVAPSLNMTYFDTRNSKTYLSLYCW